MESLSIQETAIAVGEIEKRVADKPSSDPVRAKQVIEVTVAAGLGVSCTELRARTRRSASTAFARQVAMYLAHVVYGLNLTESGHLFGRDRTTAAHACSVVEDRRDDPSFDTQMDQLEHAILRLQKITMLPRAC